MAEVAGADGAALAGDGYVLINNTWGRRDLANGHDYVQTVADGPGGVNFAWDWPMVAPRRVLAYPELVVGESPWSGHVAGDLLPARLSDLDGLMAWVRLDWGGEAARFNVAFDLWLKPEPGRGKPSHEVMVWLKAAEFGPGGKLAGTISVGGFEGAYRHKAAVAEGWPQWHYAAFQSRADIREGWVDIGALLDHLVAEGVAAPELWLMDVELGAEVTGGAGWLRIEGFALSVNGETTALVGPPPPASMALTAEPVGVWEGVQGWAFGLLDLLF